MDIKEEMQTLINTLNYQTELYDKGSPQISDEEWDTLYFNLQRLEQESGIILPESPTNHISFTVVNKLEKVKHNHPMLSLAKTKEVNDVIKFCNGIHMIAMAKMDGLTCSLTYRNGKLVAAETRGNGVEGENILHNVQIIPSIPKTISSKEEVIIDGEIICTYKDFEKFSTQYKNPRNFAAGSIRLLDAKECFFRNLTFVAWDVIKGSVESFLDLRLKELKEKYKFMVVPFQCFTNINDVESIIKHITRVSNINQYPIDGVVFKYNDCEYYQSLGATDHHFRGGLAYKFYDEEYETTLRDIEWGMGRTGILTPVAIYDPVEIDGSICNRASLHNVSIMKNTLRFAYKGQKIKVAKMNMIIPQVVWADKEPYDVKDSNVLCVPAYCPICGEITEVEMSNDNILTLWCKNPNCEGKLVNKIDYFVGKKGLDIKGLSVATLNKLIDWGWVNSISDIFSLKEHQKEWMKKEGFGEKSVCNILEAIDKSRKVSLDFVIAGLGIPLIGKRVAADICTHIKTWDEFRGLIKNNFDFSTWEGFGEEKKNSLLKYDYTEIDTLIQKGIISVVSVENNNKISNTLNGLSFVITGKVNHFKNRDEIKADIESFGGKVVSSVTNKVNYLINNDINSASSKNVTAKKLGIPIITEEEYLKLKEKI